MSSVPAEGRMSQTVSPPTRQDGLVFEDWEGLGKWRQGKEAEGREVRFQVPSFL